MISESEFLELRSIPLNELAGQIPVRFPKSVSTYWWFAVFSAIAVNLSPLREATIEERRRDIELGVELVKLTSALGTLGPTTAANCLLRLSAATMRFDPPIEGLPYLSTPDGAAQWALDRIPLTREVAIATAEAERAEVLEAGEEFYVTTPPVGVNYQPSPLLGVEEIVGTLSWVQAGINDPRVRREVQAWLDIEDSL